MERCSLLSLPVHGGKALQGDGLRRLQERLAGVRYIIIDELSMASQAQMAGVDRRLRRATGKTTVPFGGVSIIMTGDPGQLPPVGGRPLHALDPKDQLNQEGFQAYRQLTAAFILTRCKRQDAAGADDVDQKGFLELLPRDRDGTFTDEDWHLLLKRSPALQTAETKARFADATRLFFSKNQADGYSGKKVRGLGSPTPSQPRTTTVRRQGVRRETRPEVWRRYFSEQRPPRLCATKHLWQEVGLVNGIRGEVVEIVYAEEKPALAPPQYVVRFDGYTGSPWSSEDRYYSGCVLMSPEDATWSSCRQNGEGNTMTKAQLSLKLCWALTMHKSQQTLPMPVIDLGKREACTGLTFVCLSRAKRIVDLIVEPMPFDRISRLEQSPVLKARMVDEFRLRLLAD